MADSSAAFGSDGGVMDISAEDLLGDLQTSIGKSLDDPDQVQELFQRRKDVRRRLEMSLLQSVASGSKEEMRSKLQQQYIKLLVQLDTNQRFAENQRATLSEHATKQEQLSAELAQLQAKLAAARIKRAQYRYKHNRALAKYLAIALVADNILQERRKIEADTATMRYVRDTTVMRAFDAICGSLAPDLSAELGGIFRIKTQMELDAEDDEDEDDDEDDAETAAAAAAAMSSGSAQIQPGAPLSEMQAKVLKLRQREYARRLDEICGPSRMAKEYRDPRKEVPPTDVDFNFPWLEMGEDGSLLLNPSNDLLAWAAQQSQMQQAAAAAMKRPKSPSVPRSQSDSSMPEKTNHSSPSSAAPQPTKKKGFFGLFQ